MPAVSVIIPTYNRAALAARAVYSALNQTYADVEVLVVDDCSTDATPQVMGWLQDTLPQARGRIRYFRQARNAGANAARNLGIRAAHGKYVAFLDSDDLWHPMKLELQLERLDWERSRNWGGRAFFGFTGRLRVDGAYQVLAAQFPGSMRKANQAIRKANAVGTLSSVIVDAWLARYLGGFNEQLRACQDWDFYCRAIPMSHVYGVNEPLVLYYDAQFDRVSLNHRNRLKAHLWMYRRHLKKEVHPADLGEFYRNVAEDLEGLGKIAWARRFASLGSWRLGQYSRAIEIGWHTREPRVKAARYFRYAARPMSNGSDAYLAGFRSAIAFGEDVERHLRSGEWPDGAARDGDGDRPSRVGESSDPGQCTSHSGNAPADVTAVREPQAASSR